MNSTISPSMQKLIYRDISWLAFNNRVLQEAADSKVPLKERIKFLGIVSNNRDEFFKVRVASLKRMLRIATKQSFYKEKSPQKILTQIHKQIEFEQNEYERIWAEIQDELNRNKIFLKTYKQLNKVQQKFATDYYDAEISSNIIPLLIDYKKPLPNLRDAPIYLGIVMSKSFNRLERQYAVLEVPVNLNGRFILLPSAGDKKEIILLEEIIKFNLPNIFKFLGYDIFNANIFKFTRDAELDIDTSDSQNIIPKLEKELKNRKKGKPIRLAYDALIDEALLNLLIKKLGLSKKLDSVVPGGMIHNFRDFVSFPKSVFKPKDLSNRPEPFEQPLLKDQRISDIIIHKDVLLHFPYHSFTSLIDLIREASFDPDVKSIKITCYRLAEQSKIINALINAVRNGKDVTIMLELRARFDEEANLRWKQRLEDEGAKVITGFTNMKVHAKVCIIKKKVKNKWIEYGFVSTGNLNENTAKIYGDHCLLTANKKIMNDITRVFNYLENPKSQLNNLNKCTDLLVSPFHFRDKLKQLIDNEIAIAKKGKYAAIILKMNSLSDAEMIHKLYEAATHGVEIKLIIRGIFCMFSQNRNFKYPIQAISIVDEYLEHARVCVFHNRGNKKVFISSADWMMRNIDHRIEVTCPITNAKVKQELIDILNIQLKDNTKARILDNHLSNKYVSNKEKSYRSQIETYHYLKTKIK